MVRFFSVVALLMATTFPALAQQCDTRSTIVTHLGTKYDEARVGVGLSNTGTMVEIFLDPESGTWTILETSPNQSSCIRLYGENFFFVSEDPVKEQQEEF